MTLWAENQDRKLALLGLSLDRVADAILCT